MCLMLDKKSRLLEGVRQKKHPSNYYLVLCHPCYWFHIGYDNNCRGTLPLKLSDAAYYNNSAPSLNSARPSHLSVACCLTHFKSL